MHLWASFTRIGLMTVVTTVAYVIGSSGTVDKILKLIPQAFIDGMNIATNILPAVGFAMLINMTFSKKWHPSFLRFRLCRVLEIRYDRNCNDWRYFCRHHVHHF